MFQSMLQIATVALVMGLAAGPAPVRADAPKPDKPTAADPKGKSDKPTKPVKPVNPDGKKVPVIQGTVKSVDAGTNTVVIAPAKPTAEPRTYPLTTETKVSVDGNPAKLTDLKAGYHVTLKLTEDQKAVVGIGAEGPSLTGELKAVEPAKHTIQVKVVTHPDPTDKTKTGTEEKTLAVVEDVKVTVQGQKKATLADLKPGASVAVRLTADGGRVYAISSPAKRAESGDKKPEKPTKPEKPAKGDKPMPDKKKGDPAK